GPANGNTSGNELVDVAPFDSMHLWAVGYDGIGYSADGGNTWQTHLAGSGLFDRVSFPDTQNGWVDDGGILWRTSDGGASWVRKNSGFNFYDVTFIPEPSAFAYIGLCVSAL